MLAVVKIVRITLFATAESIPLYYQIVCPEIGDEIFPRSEMGLSSDLKELGWPGPVWLLWLLWRHRRSYFKRLPLIEDSRVLFWRCIVASC